jgi:hypothetical protein
MRKPDKTWRQIMYVGRRAGSFTLTGRATGIDYLIVPGRLIAVHPSDLPQFQKKARGKNKEYRIVW